MASLVADYSDTDDEERHQKLSPSTTTAALFYNTDDSSGSDDDQSLDDEELNENEEVVSARLPHPDFLDHQDIVSSSSVFGNPFLAAEEAKNMALERHVKMSSNAKCQSRMINGRQVCWNYRKGRCRFGHNCKFAHDSDVSGGISGSSDDHVVMNDGDDADSDNEQGGVIIKSAKRKKPGLSDTLVPPKRSMKAYQKQQSKQSPWLQLSTSS